jgi:hypothetical protein
MTAARCLLCSALVLASAAAHADWVRAGETPEASFFVDLGSVEKDGSNRRFWELTDLKQRGKEGEMSMRARVLYDCQGQRARTLTLTVHAEAMASGKTLFVGGEDPQGWVAVASKSVSGDKLRMVCAR